MSAAPFYGLSREYAARNGELEQYEDSMKQNIACARAIERAIDKTHSKPLEESIQNIIRRYDIIRLSWVTAVSVQALDDGRFCKTNKLWASIYTMPPEPERSKVLIHAHPAKLDNFALMVRDAYGRSFFPAQKATAEPDPSEQSTPSAEPEQGGGMMML